MLLVDDDQRRGRSSGANTAERGPTQIRASPRAQPPPLVVALAGAELRVQHRDRVAEALDEARDDLRRQRDLGHEHDHRRRSSALAAARR